MSGETIDQIARYLVQNRGMTRRSCILSFWFTLGITILVYTELHTAKSAAGPVVVFAVLGGSVLLFGNAAFNPRWKKRIAAYEEAAARARATHEETPERIKLRKRRAILLGFVAHLLILLVVTLVMMVAGVWERMGSFGLNSCKMFLMFWVPLGWIPISLALRRFFYNHLN